MVYGSLKYVKKVKSINTILQSKAVKCKLVLGENPKIKINLISFKIVRFLIFMYLNQIGNTFLIYFYKSLSRLNPIGVLGFSLHLYGERLPRKHLEAFYNVTGNSMLIKHCKYASN